MRDGIRVAPVMAARGYQVGVRIPNGDGRLYFCRWKPGRAGGAAKLGHVKRSWFDESLVSGDVEGKIFFVAARNQGVLPMPFRGRDRALNLFRGHAKSGLNRCPFGECRRHSRAGCDVPEITSRGVSVTVTKAPPAF